MRNRRMDERGFTIITAGICAAAMVGMLGLAVDLGRVYITKNEAQAYTDTAVIAAARQLNGISFVNARNAVTNNTSNRWNMATDTFTASGGNTTIRTEFALPLAANLSKPDPDTWSQNPASAAGYTFVKVTATANLALYFLPIVGTTNSDTVPSVSVAGQVPVTSFTNGLLPFSPMAHPGAPNFGLVPGRWYTLRYPGGSHFNNGDLCQGDQGDLAFLQLANLQVSDQRGFYQDPAASIAAAEIINGQMAHEVDFPGTISMYGGAMNTTGGDLNTRISMDTDHTSRTYAEYQSNIVNGQRVGNGFRLVGAPINAGPPVGNSGGPRDVLGFAGFFLSNDAASWAYNGGGGQPFCAQYYGTYCKGCVSEGAGVPGIAYQVGLVQ